MESPYKVDFPIFQRRINGHPLTYLDSAASAQKPAVVIQALTDFYTLHNANVHRGVHTLSEEASQLFENARAKTAAFIGAPAPACVLFTRGTTESINMAAQSWALPRLQKGDEIVLTALEHHSNLLPWRHVAAQTGAVVRMGRVDDKGMLDADHLESLLGEKTRLLALTHTSNVTGEVLPLERLITAAKTHGAAVLVDGAQGVPHLGVDVSRLGCDFLAFSGHKMLAPTGIGALYVAPKRLEEMVPYQLGGGMVARVEDGVSQTSQWREPPWCFEAGTPDIAGAHALAAAIRYLEELDADAVSRQEAILTTEALRALGDLPGLTLYGPDAEAPRKGVIAFNLDGIHPHDVAEVLDGHGVAVRAGHMCCQPLMQSLDVQAVVRASLYLYNDLQDIQRLVHGLQQVQKVFAP